MRIRRSTSSVIAIASLVVGSLVGAAGPAVAHQGGGGGTPVAQLPLGSRNLPQTATSQQLERGVTLTKIVRGAFDPATPWVVELTIPDVSNPDPDAPGSSVKDRTSADHLVSRLAAAGFSAQAQPVRQPRTVDTRASVIGYRVRLTARYSSQAAATAVTSQLTAAGFTGRTWYKGWDGGSDAAGQWTVNIVTIDPRQFRGALGATYGPDLYNRETTTALSAYVGAEVAINGGFFVLDPAAGAPGDPAGVGVYNGQLESEVTAGRPALLLDSRARNTAVIRPSWRGTVSFGRTTLRLDGLNRVPGLIRNCGGIGDTPTDRPQQDVTCTDVDELVAFTSAYGTSTPSGSGSEAVLNSRGTVISVQQHRGVQLQPGQRSIQATGNLADRLTGLHQGQRAHLRTVVTDGRSNLQRRGVTVVNGGPQLVQHGDLFVTQSRDGMVHAADPSFAYGWALQRNPRTFAGVDAKGRTLLVTVDGRQSTALGLSLQEEARVAKALGMVQAMNLDGGGSTAMAIDGRLISHPSDKAGERPVGDVIYLN
ncbi:MAG: phosphodiester glycosidase family protein [Actinomycetota bacterium]|nr:phosphodiester glycosidase family protein [Actinomycetota bacterium]